MNDMQEVDWEKVETGDKIIMGLTELTVINQSYVRVYDGDTFESVPVLIAGNEFPDSTTAWSYDELERQCAMVEPKPSQYEVVYLVNGETRNKTYAAMSVEDACEKFHNANTKNNPRIIKVEELV